MLADWFHVIATQRPNHPPINAASAPELNAKLNSDSIFMRTAMNFILTKQREITWRYIVKGRNNKV